jgi:hypothetical protein
MIGSTLTHDNLNAIKKAMDKIKPIDQSDYFKNYYKEVEDRLAAIEKDKRFLN